MAYSKQTWVRGEKVASSKLNHMEDGIAEISAPSAIDTANLAPAAVTNAKIDQAAVDSDNIRTGAIITPLIYDGAVTLPKLGADVIAELDNKADIDGSYESMTVGNAEQLISSVGIIDQTPYNFRTSGGSVDIGDREELNAVVGATVAWNQLVQNGNFNGDMGHWVSSGTATRSVSNNVLTITSSAINAMMQTLPLASANGHRILFCGTLSATASVNFGIYKNSSGTYAAAISPVDGTKVRIERIVTISAVSTDTFDIRIRANTADSTTITAENVNVFDLTALLGATIADYIYALEQANAGAGVAYFRKLFPKPYYAYNSGELLSVRTSAHKMVGFNQWDEQWEVGGIGNGGFPTSSTNQIRSKNFCKILPDTTYYATCGKTDGGNQNRYYLGVTLYDDNLNFIATVWSNNLTFTTPSNARFFKITTNSSTVVYGTTYNHDICINLSWDGERDGEYEPYEAHEYALDDITLCGILKLDASNNLYADGDRYLPDGTVERRYGIVDLGEIAWSGNASSNGHFTGTLSTDTFAPYKWASNTLMICGAYMFDGRGNSPLGYFGENGTFRYYYNTSGSQPREIYINDESKSSMTPADFKTAMSGIYLVYELETPTTETADPYQQTQIVEDFGTEEFVDNRDVAVPVGNITFYPQNLRKKIEGLPFDFSTLIARTEKAFKATKAYVVNEFLIINNHLYKTRTSIANGATITVGTNVIATTIGAELTAILNS